MTSPSSTLALLKKLGIRPSKRLSQNFLVDNNILQKIVETAHVQKGECLLEVGPGLGALTEALLQKGATIFAVEKDRHLFAHLQSVADQNKDLHLFNADILDFPVATTLPSKVKVVANIPYQITSPLLDLLLPLYPQITSLTLLVQDELARRLVAQPKTKDYSALTLFTQLHCDPTYCFKVSRRCFLPAPKVDSAVVFLRLKPPPQNLDALLPLIRTAFNQRRKMLTTSLKKLFSSQKVAEALLEIGLNSKARPEELSVDQFIRFQTHL